MNASFGAQSAPIECPDKSGTRSGENFTDRVRLPGSARTPSGRPAPRRPPDGRRRRNASYHLFVEARGAAPAFIREPQRAGVTERCIRTLREQILRTRGLEYNREKDWVTIERTFEKLLKLVAELDREESRAVREGLDEESLALFDLLRKDGLSANETRKVKKAAVELLEIPRPRSARVSRWREKEATRAAVRAAAGNFLWTKKRGCLLPATARKRLRPVWPMSIGMCSGCTPNCRPRTTKVAPPRRTARPGARWCRGSPYNRGLVAAGSAAAAPGQEESP